MSIQQEWQGLWWRPEDPESRLPGTLHFDAENGLTLKLLGGFSITRAAALPGGVSRHSLTDDPFPILHGEFRGQPVTLIGCTAVSTQGGFFGQDIESQTVGALRAYIGIHLEAPDEPAFVEAAFELEYLLEWS